MIRLRALVFSLVCAGLIVGAIPRAQARSFTFERIDIDVRVTPDGTMHVVEDRRVRFDGTFRGMFRDIGLRPPEARYGGYEVRLDRVLDDGKPLRRVLPIRLEPGAYTAYPFGDGVRFEWQYAASDVTKTFRLEYRVLGHVKRYRDIAELWWTFIEGDRPADVEDARVTVSLPPGAQARAWGHGTFGGDVTIVNPKTVRFAVPGLPPGEELGARIAFAPSTVPGAPARDEVRLRTILLEEQAAADAANARRRSVKFWNILPLLIALGWLVLWIRMFRRHGREHRVEVPQYLRELPAEYPPAIVGWLRGWGSVEPANMTATILDLARRGHLTIEETTRTTGVIRKKEVSDTRIVLGTRPRTGLMPYEIRVLELLGKVAAAEGEVTSHAMHEWAKAGPERMQSEMTAFTTEVRSHGRTLGLIEDRVQMIVLALLGSFLVIVTAILAISNVSGSAGGSAPLAILAIAIAVVLICLTPLLRQRTKGGSLDHERWEAFRRFLSDFSRMKEAGPGAIVLWDHYLVYAVALGVADEVIEAMKVHLPPTALQNGSTFGWYHAAGGHGWQSLDSFNASMSTLNQSLAVTATQAFATAPSSGSGGGGGFSGGGGGGGGGGGSSGAY